MQIKINQCILIFSLTKFLSFSFLNIQKQGITVQNMIASNDRNFDAECFSMLVFTIQLNITIAIMIILAWNPVETVM